MFVRMRAYECMHVLFCVLTLFTLAAADNILGCTPAASPDEKIAPQF